MPEVLSARTGIPFDRQRQVFSLSSLGRDMEIDYPGYEIRPAVDDWHHLLILHYLDLADGTPLSHQLMTFGDLPSGMVRGGSFDRQSEQDLGLRLGHAPQAQVERACRALGGILTPSNADICAVFSLFPNYPITLKLWFADEEITRQRTAVPGPERFPLPDGRGRRHRWLRSDGGPVSRAECPLLKEAGMAAAA